MTLQTPSPRLAGRTIKEGNSMDLLDDFTAKVSMGIAGQIEQRVRIIINDKPKRMSKSNWESICRKVISVQYYPVRLSAPTTDKGE
jgi:hypothetical protein